MIAIRTKREIAIMRDANRIVAEVLAAMAEAARPGVTTGELDALAEAIILRSGAEPAFKGYRGYPAATCISLDEVVVHGIPGGRVLEPGQIVSMDVGTRYKSYYGDAAYSLACGGSTGPERQCLMDTTDLALSRAVRAARTGNHLADISKAIERTCRPLGYGVVESFVGHGIGRQMHEEPQISNVYTGRRGPRLKTGMVFAIEPMINLGTHNVCVLEDGWTAMTADGLPSAHFEHSIVVRDGGGEILSDAGGLIWGRRAE